MAMRSPHGGLQSAQVRAALYYARKRRLARIRSSERLSNPPLLFSASRSSYNDTSDMTLPASVTADNVNGKLILDGSVGSVNVDRTIQALDTSKTYTFHAAFTNPVAGRIQTYVRDGGSNLFIGANKFLAGHHVTTFSPSNPHTTVRISCLSQSGNPQFELTDIQIVDITDLISRPKAIIISAGQSNEGFFAVTGHDHEIDRPEYRALAVPSLEQISISAYTDNSGATFGLNANAGIGELMTMSSPLPGASPAQINFGDQPATLVSLSMMRHLCDNWSHKGFTPTALLGSASSSSLFTGWDWDSDPQGPYLRLLKANIDSIISNYPGSFVAGMRWQQGEADVSNFANYNSEFSGLVNHLRQIYGNFPLAVCEIGGPSNDPGTQSMRLEQTKLDSRSGDISALNKCRYIARPSGLDSEILEDEGGNFIHFNATSNRDMGTRAGQAIVEMT